jgi:acetylornithine/N-succinyldiaminopimelate aminotransferase
MDVVGRMNMHGNQTSSLFTTYSRRPLAFDHGRGSYLFTADGERYLDFAGGVAVNALGHAHPKLVEALTRQAQRLWHVSNLYTIPEQEMLARRLCELTFAERVFFNNSGAEAVETAIKTARRYHAHNGQPARYRLITFKDAFHGRTLATIAAGGKKDHLQGFGPAVDGFDQVEAGDIARVRAAVNGMTAGIMIEPVQGEGGINLIAPSFLRELRALCDELGLLLIFDEVQTGMGRTGKLFAYEWSGVTPDIMAIAKGIGGGFPLGACLATTKAAEGMLAGSHGSTFGGNPLAMAVGLAVLEVVTAPGFIEEVGAKGLYALQKLAAVKDANADLVVDVRGQGLLIGIELVDPPAELVGDLIDQHLLSVPASHNVVRLLPPLNVSREEIDAAVGALERALASCRERRKRDRAEKIDTKSR